MSPGHCSEKSLHLSANVIVLFDEPTNYMHLPHGLNCRSTAVETDEPKRTRGVCRNWEAAGSGIIIAVFDAEKLFLVEYQKISDSHWIDLKTNILRIEILKGKTGANN